MDTIVLNTANSKTKEPHKYVYNLTNTMKLDDHYICLSNLSMYYTWKNIRAEYGNNILIYYIPDPDNPIPGLNPDTLISNGENRKPANGKFVWVTLPDGSYSIKDINNYLHMKMIAEKDGTNEDFPISIYPNTVYNRVSIVLKSGFQLILSRGMANVLGFSNQLITNTSTGDLVPQIERVEVVMVHCNMAQNNFTQDSSLIYSFVPNSAYGTQLHQRPRFPIWRQARKTSERSIDIWFTDQLYRPLEIEDNILVEIQLAPKSFI